MAKFRHNPTEIEAFRLTHPMELPVQPTPERDGKGKPGRWMARNCRGEWYFLTDEEFRQLYHPIDEDAKVMFNARLLGVDES